jgi:hypothetical protein
MGHNLRWRGADTEFCARLQIELAQKKKKLGPIRFSDRKFTSLPFASFHLQRYIYKHYRTTVFEVVCITYRFKLA